MPRPRPWLAQIPRIIRSLDDLPETTLLNRRDVQELFGIGASAAKDLMTVVGPQKFPGPDGGSAVSQANLMRYLQHSPEAQQAMQELARRAKLAARLTEANGEQKLRRVAIPVTSADEWCTLADLPNVAIEDGVLRVAFASPAELMGDLYRLCKAAGNNWDEFVRVCRRDEIGAA